MTFLGLTKEEWEIAAPLAAWLGAIATFMAVLTSLHLARRDSRVALKVCADIAYVLGSNPAKPYVMISVVNVGRQIVKVTSVGWCIGKRKKDRLFFVQPAGPSDGISSPLPIILEHGHDARWFLPADDWMADVHLLKDRSGTTDLDSFRVVAHSSVGTEFPAPIQKRLREEIEKALLIQQAEGKPSFSPIVPD